MEGSLGPHSFWRASRFCRMSGSPLVPRELGNRERAFRGEVPNLPKDVEPRIPASRLGFCGPVRPAHKTLGPHPLLPTSGNLTGPAGSKGTGRLSASAMGAETRSMESSPDSPTTRHLRQHHRVIRVFASRVAWQTGHRCSQTRVTDKGFRREAGSSDHGIRALAGRLPRY